MFISETAMSQGQFCRPLLGLAEKRPVPRLTNDIVLRVRAFRDYLSKTRRSEVFSFSGTSLPIVGRRLK